MGPGRSREAESGGPPADSWRCLGRGYAEVWSAGPWRARVWVLRVGVGVVGLGPPDGGEGQGEGWWEALFIKSPGGGGDDGVVRGPGGVRRGAAAALFKRCKRCCL